MRNGKLAQTLLRILLAGVGGVLVGFAGWTAHEIRSCHKMIDDHEKSAGHAAIVERMKGVEEDVREIKADVKTLLSRNTGADP
jgi:hypothetical protein